MSPSVIVYTKTMLWDISDIIRHYIFPGVVLFGTILNTLSIYVFTHPSLRSTTTAFLLIILAVTDILSLYTGTFQEWLTTVADIYIFVRTDVSCLIYYYIWRIIKTCPGWVLCAVTLERVINMVKPHRAVLICTRENMSKLLATVLLLTL